MKTEFFDLTVSRQHCRSKNPVLINIYSTLNPLEASFINNSSKVGEVSFRILEVLEGVYRKKLKGVRDL